MEHTHLLHTEQTHGQPEGTVDPQTGQNISNFERALSIGLGALLMLDGIKKIKRKPVQSLSRAAVGYALIARGSTGTCPLYRKMHIDGTKTTSVNIRTHITVNKPREEVYAFWRNLANLPRFMRHLASVRVIDAKRSHWEAKIPDNNPMSIKWDAEIVKDEPGAFLSWQSLPGSVIGNAGKVEFRDALGHRGTDVRIVISYRPPAGNIGSGVSRLFNPLFRKMVHDDLINFKQVIEMSGPSAVEGYVS